jgi:CRP-like cAMP-binding protein
MQRSKEEIIRFIQSVFPVADTLAEELVAPFTERVVFKNDFLLAEGQLSDEYFFLQEGFMRAFTFDIDANEVTTGFYSNNQVVFEIASFFQRTLSSESIQALTNCRGWSISFEELNKLFHMYPEFREFGRGILVRNLVFLKQRMLSMINETAEQRYARLIKNNPEIFQNASLKHIASYLGITDTSLSRIRKEFSKR